MSFENRMVNWRNTVRGGFGGGRGVCAGWAAAYVAARDDREMQLAIALQIVSPSSDLGRAEVNELDGWLVEAAVRSMGFYDQREVLRMRYVWEYSNHYIKTKLRHQYPRINDTSVRIILGRAIINLNLLLDKFHAPATIRSNNLHARCVPRPEACAVPDGTVAPLGNDEVLMD